MVTPDHRALPKSEALLRRILEENGSLIKFYRKCRDLDSHILPNKPVDVEAIRSKISRVDGKTSWLQRKVPEFRPLYKLPQSRWEFVRRYMPEEMLLRLAVAHEKVKDSRNHLEEVAQATINTEGFRHAFSRAVFAAGREVQNIIDVHDEFEARLCEAIDSTSATVKRRRDHAKQTDRNSKGVKPGRTVPTGKILLGKTLQFDWLTYLAQGKPDDENETYDYWRIDVGLSGDFVSFEEAKALRRWFNYTHSRRHTSDAVSLEKGFKLSDDDKTAITGWLKSHRKGKK